MVVDYLFAKSNIVYCLTKSDEVWTEVKIFNVSIESIIRRDCQEVVRIRRRASQLGSFEGRGLLRFLRLKRPLCLICFPGRRPAGRGASLRHSETLQGRLRCDRDQLTVLERLRTWRIKRS